MNNLQGADNEITGKIKTVAVINDFTTCEEIALGIQMPILRDMGHRVYPIPSKLLNYPLCVEGAVELETVGFAKGMFNYIMNSQDKIDAVLTGFIPSVELAWETMEFCKKQKTAGAVIFVDPVFGDNGKPYMSVRPENIDAAKKLLSAADYCFPNYTEACILTETEYKDVTIPGGMTPAEAKELLLKLKFLGAKVPVVTGCIVDNMDVIIFMDESNDLSFVPYERVKGHLAGTGDRFAATVSGDLLKGASLEAAIRTASAGITERILREKKLMNSEID